jgi:hypothetical protein
MKFILVTILIALALALTVDKEDGDLQRAPASS